MRKVLILTASTGEGHNQAANSLANIFSAKNYETIKFDFIKESNKILNSFIVDGYKILASNCPKLYGSLYKRSDVKQINDGVIKYISKIAEKKVYESILINKPSIVIGTHPFAVSIMSRIKETRGLDIPFVSIVTDFKAHYAYIDKYVDAYITASEYTRKSMLDRSVPRGKIFTYGIPIKEEFLNNNEKYSCKSKDCFTLLIMGGSMGVKGIGKVLKEVIQNSHKLKVVVVCGNNKSLKKTLEKKYANTVLGDSIEILGYTREISRLMDKADAVITKPGGLTVSEAIAKKLPMIIPYAIPGQEEENTEFLVQAGVAVKVEDMFKINNIIDEFIENPELILNMKKNLEKLLDSYSVHNIIGLSETLIEKNSFNENLLYERKFRSSIELSEAL